MFAVFLTVDLSFFGANLLKIVEGGWFPLAIAFAIYAVMVTWLWGRRQLALRARPPAALPLATLIDTLKPDRPARVPGTAIYMTARLDNVPDALLHNMKHNKVLHERNVLMTVRTEDVPRLPEAERLRHRSPRAEFPHRDASATAFSKSPISRAPWRCAGSAASAST